MLSKDTNPATDDKDENLSCPYCGATSPHEEFRGSALWAFIALWPFMPVKRTWRCAQCNRSWKQWKW
jgi:hypothetical protein